MVLKDGFDSCVKMHYYCDKSQDHDVTMTFTTNHFSMADVKHFILQFMFMSRENLVLVSMLHKSIQ